MVHKLNVQIDLQKLLQLYQHAREHFAWTDSFPTLQSGISVAEGKEDDLLSCCGGNFSAEHEKRYSHLHHFYQNSYISDLSSLLQLKIFRLRWMKLSEKSCYSFHQDWSRRLHIPIISSKDSYFLFQHPLELLNLDVGCAYILDTTRVHTALNTGLEERVHLIACIDE